MSITLNAAADDLPVALQRLERIVAGATLQVAYSAEAYEPIGDKLRADLRLVLDAAATARGIARPSFQAGVADWMQVCFGPEISGDREERNHRFLEEAVELVQAAGCTAHEAHQLVTYVFGRPVGEKRQEVGGVMVTLAALCLAHDIDLAAAADTEFARVWTKLEAIRAKQAAKPKHSPLPA